MNLPFLDDDREVVDVESGEIITVPEGDSLLDRIAHEARRAQLFQAYWERRYNWLRSEFVRRQEPKSAVYRDNIRVSIRQNSRGTLNRERFRARVEDADLTEDDIYQFLFAATGFSTDELPERLAKLVARSFKAGKPYAVVDVVGEVPPEGE